jgi:di/tricarboxylate transporter
MDAFSIDIWLTFTVLVFVILVFIFEWIRVDVVGKIMMVLLPLLGLVTPAEGISGLSSNAVVSIIAVMIIGAGLDRTGVMKSLAHLIFKFAGKRENRIMVLISAAVAGISGFMQNIGAAALFMPAVKRIATQTGTPISSLIDSLSKEAGALYEMRVPDSFEPTTLIALGIRENYCSSIDAIARISPREKLPFSKSRLGENFIDEAYQSVECMTVFFWPG